MWGDGRLEIKNIKKKSAGQFDTPPCLNSDFNSDFLLDGNSLQRYFSSTQADVNSGLLLHWSVEISPLKNIISTFVRKKQDHLENVFFHVLAFSVRD